MKPPLVIGAAIVLVVVAGGLFSRAFVSAATAGARQAQLSAELARRELDLFATGISELTSRIDLPGLKQSDLRALVDAYRTQFEGLAPAFNQAIGAAASRDKRAGFPTALKPIGLGAEAVKAALANYEKWIAQNDGLLKSAEKHANEARGVDAEAIGVNQVVGMVASLKAVLSLHEAETRQAELAEQQSQLIRLASAQKYERGDVDLFAGLDVKDTVEGLRKDLAEVSALEAQCGETAAALAAAVEQRRGELQAVGAELSAARDELLALEQKGFAAGDDAQFEAYRKKHAEVSARLRAAQQREEELRFGGRRGAVLGDDLARGEIEGGEPVRPLADLEFELEKARAEQAGYGKSRGEVERQIEFVQKRGTAAGEAGDNARKNIQDLEARIKATFERIAALLDQSYSAERAALESAAAAARAFDASKRATGQWMARASTVQREQDPKRTNERLKIITNDEFLNRMDRIGASAEAAAYTLIGRIQTQRAVNLARHVKVMERLTELLPGSQFDPKQIEERIATARDEAPKALGKARDAYEKLVTSGPANVAWVPQAHLASVYYLMAQAEPAAAEAHLQKALESIEAAVTGREHSPYLAAHVNFRAHLRAAVKAAAAPAEPAPDAEADGNGQPPDQP